MLEFTTDIISVSCITLEIDCQVETDCWGIVGYSITCNKKLYTAHLDKCNRLPMYSLHTENLHIVQSVEIIYCCNSKLFFSGHILRSVAYSILSGVPLPSFSPAFKCISYKWGEGRESTNVSHFLHQTADRRQRSVMGWRWSICKG